MELTAIYHRPESEYAYLYKEGQLHIRIRTKKNDVQKVILHYGDPFIFIEDKYEAKKEMTKVTSDALFDYWQVTVSVDFARIQYLFELLDEEGQGVFYGDKGCVEHTQENLDADGNGFKLPYNHEIDGCQVPSWVSNTVWYQIFPERFANGNPHLTSDGTYLKSVDRFLLEPDAVARKIVKTIGKNKRELNLPVLLNLAHKFYTLFPKLADKLAGGIFNYKKSSLQKELFL